MKALDLKRAMAEKRLTFGTWLTFSDSFVAEMMVRHGAFDWVVVDMEHSAIGLEGQGRLIQTIDLSGAVPLVRVGANDVFMIKRALDSGAAGVIVPQVNTAEDARAAVDAAYYPPKGSRGVGLFRAQDYGQGFDSYRRASVEQTIVIAQIEHFKAVENLEAILAVDGIDGFIIGPYDLSASIGKPGAFDDPDVSALLDQLGGVLRDHPKPGGYHVVQSDRAALARRIDQGARFLAYGIDMIFLGEKLADERGAMDALRDRG